MNIRDLPSMINIDKKDREKYTNLKQDNFFKDFENKDLFFVCVAYGKIYNKKEQIKPVEGFFRASFLNEEDIALIEIINFSERVPEDVVKSFDEYFNIIEQYAHAGLKILTDVLSSKQFGTTDTEIEKTVNELLCNINL